MCGFTKSGNLVSDTSVIFSIEIFNIGGGVLTWVSTTKAKAPIIEWKMRERINDFRVAFIGVLKIASGGSHAYEFHSDIHGLSEIRFRMFLRRKLCKDL